MARLAVVLLVLTAAPPLLAGLGVSDESAAAGRHLRLQQSARAADLQEEEADGISKEDEVDADDTDGDTGGDTDSDTEEGSDEPDDDDDKDEAGDVRDEAIGEEIAEGHEAALKEEARRPEETQMRHTIAVAQASLDENLKEQAKINTKISDSSNEELSSVEIDATVRPIVNETQSAALAGALGAMWKEMRMYQMPDYIEKLRVRLQYLKREEKVLQGRLGGAQGARKAVEQKWVADDQEAAAREERQDEPDSVAAADTTLPPQRARTEARGRPADGKYQPMYTAETMPAISPTIWCVIVLSVVFFAVYTIMAVLRSISQLTGDISSVNLADEVSIVDSAIDKWQSVLFSLCKSVTYAPMLCVLFLATRMRAIQLSQGQTEKYNLPQPWVQSAMYLSTVALTLQVIVLLFVKYFEYFKPEFRNRNGLEAANHVVRICLYGGFTAVCVGVLTMAPPRNLWRGVEPPASAVIVCTVTLTCSAFAIYLLRAVVQTVQRMQRKLAHLSLICDTAMYYANLTPMACIMLISARMRTLQINPDDGSLPPRTETAMYMCAIALPVVLIASFIPAFDSGAHIVEGPGVDDKVLKPKSMTIILTTNIIRYLALLIFYAGAIFVMWSVLSLRSPDGMETPPLSAAVHCVIVLSNVYFFTYSFLFVANTVKDWFSLDRRDDGRGGSATVDIVVQTAEAGQRAVMFAPMLCMLFIGARMRALQLTMTVNGKVPPNAGPQAWAQEGMVFATWAVVIQLLATYVTTLVLGTPSTLDKATPRHLQKGGNRTLGIVLAVIKYGVVVAMFAGTTIVIVAIFKMTPEVLLPYSEYEGLVPGVKVVPPPTMDTQAVRGGGVM